MVHSVPQPAELVFITTQVIRTQGAGLGALVSADIEVPTITADIIPKIANSIKI